MLPCRPIARRDPASPRLQQPGGHAACAPGSSPPPVAVSSASASAPTKVSTDRIADYVAGIRAFADLASWFTVNVSSPNTPGLRDLQARDQLTDLLRPGSGGPLTVAATGARQVPVLLDRPGHGRRRPA